MIRIKMRIRPDLAGQTPLMMPATDYRFLVERESRSNLATGSLALVTVPAEAGRGAAVVWVAGLGAKAKR